MATQASTIRTLRIKNKTQRTRNAKLHKELKELKVRYNQQEDELMNIRLCNIISGAANARLVRDALYLARERMQHARAHIDNVMELIRVQNRDRILQTYEVLPALRELIRTASLYEMTGLSACIKQAEDAIYPPDSEE